jgi:hypothetical protein
MRRQARRAAEELAAECDAILSGRYPDYLRSHGRDVPVWAWTNPLAHASDEALRAIVATRSHMMAPADRWPHACRYVAGELLDLAECNGPLAELQATVLVPLELDLIARPGVASWKPGTWVETVTAALPGHRRRRRGSGRTIPPG